MMPRYFFHFRNRNDLKEDYEGDELADVAAAKETAMTSAREIIADGMLGDEAVLSGCSFEVCDAAGKLLFAFPFSQAAAKPDPPA
jgi:hypothetical protein